MPSRLAVPHRFQALDSLRGVCACMVALLHFRTPGLISHAPVVRHGYLFVDFFFVLSGFVIARSYEQRLAQGFSIPRFIALRLGRIYPLHLTLLTAFLIFEAAFALLAPGMADRRPFSGYYSLGALIDSLLLLHIFIGPPAAWNMPSWSIAAEFWTYVLFAAIFRTAGRFTVPLCLILAAIGLAMLSAATDRYIQVEHDWAIVRCVSGFALGVVASSIFGRMRPPSAALGTGLELAAVVAVIAFTWFAAGIATLGGPPLFLVLVLVFAWQAGPVSALLCRRSVTALGALSYSIYMIHYFIQLRLINLLSLVGKLSHGRVTLVAHVGQANEVGGSALFGDAMSLAMLGIVIGTAALTYRLIERPAQQWSRRLILGGLPPAQAIAQEREVPTF